MKRLLEMFFRRWRQTRLNLGGFWSPKTVRHPTAPASGLYGTLVLKNEGDMRRNKIEG
jgi:hypothetical protein